MPKQTISKKENNNAESEIEDEEIVEDEVVESEDEVEVEVDVEDEEVDEDETNKKNSKKVEYTTESIEETLEDISKLIINIKKDTKQLELKQKIVKKLIAKKAKWTKKRKNDPNAPKKAAGFTNIKFVPEKFKSFYENHLKDDVTFCSKFPNFKVDVDQRRPDITKIIYNYIKTNDLYDKKEDGTSNRRIIKPNLALKELLLISDGEDINFNNFQTYIKRLYNSNKPVDTHDNDNDIDAEDADDDNKIKPEIKIKKSNA